MQPTATDLAKPCVEEESGNRHVKQNTVTSCQTDNDAEELVFSEVIF